MYNDMEQREQISSPHLRFKLGVINDNAEVYNKTNGIFGVRNLFLAQF